MIYESNKCVYDFRKFRTIRPCDDSIFCGKITRNQTDKKQSNLQFTKFYFKLNDKIRPRSKLDKEIKKKKEYPGKYHCSL